MGDQEIVDRILSFRGKLKDITGRIKYMEGIIDSAIQHNIGAKMRIQMDDIPITESTEPYKDSHGYNEGDDDEQPPSPMQFPKGISGILFGVGDMSDPAFRRGYKETQDKIRNQPIDIRLDESEVIMMVGAILNLTRERKIILQKEYKKLIGKLKL